MLSSLAITLGASWLLYVSGLFIFWTPLPLFLRYARAGWQAFAFASVLALCGLLVVYGLVLATGTDDGASWVGFLALPGFGFQSYFGSPFVLGFGLGCFVYYIAVAAILGWSQDKELSLERCFALAIGLPLLVGLALLLFLWTFWGLDVVQEARGYLLHVLDQLVAVGGPAGLSNQDLQSLAARREEISEQVLRMLPAGIIVGMLMTVWGNVLVVRMPWAQLGASERKPLFEHFGPLSRWRLDERFAWVPILAGVLYFGDYYLGSGVSEEASRTLGLAGIIGLNALWIVGSLYFLQGLAIISFLVQRRGSLWLKALTYGLLILFFQVMALLVAVLGLFDVWFDFRKLTKSSQGDELWK